MYKRRLDLEGKPIADPVKHEVGEETKENSTSTELEVQVLNSKSRELEVQVQNSILTEPKVQVQNSISRELGFRYRIQYQRN